ncbi:MAG: murein transglycosylase A [Aeromonas sp.]
MQAITKSRGHCAAYRRERRAKQAALLTLILLLGACAEKTALSPSCTAGCQWGHLLGKQQRDGLLNADLVPVTRVNSTAARNLTTFAEQSALANRSQRIRQRYGALYQRLNQWVRAGGDPAILPQQGVRLAQLGGADRRGNVLFTGYYSPVLELRHTPSGAFIHPLYRQPLCQGRCPSRDAIQRGALAGQGLELGYSASLVDNFMLDVQGSGFVHYGDPQQLTYLGYGGKNGHGYVSIGRVLIERGEVAREAMSMAAIKTWAERQPMGVVKELLATNPSYVFFERRPTLEVKGAAGIPLLPMAAVAADKSLLPMGTPLLAEVPLLDNQGRWTGQHELRLLIALDVGGAVKKGHLDLYHGMGQAAGTNAGHYKHFGRVWQLSLDQPFLSAR